MASDPGTRPVIRGATGSTAGVRSPLFWPWGQREWFSPWVKGVGRLVARPAVERGLRVTGTGSNAKREPAEAIGVWFIDYAAAAGVVAAARELVPDGFDGIVDLVGGTSLRTVAPLARDPATRPP